MHVCLIKCQVCGTEGVSIEAAACPQCGDPNLKQHHQATAMVGQVRDAIVRGVLDGSHGHEIAAHVDVFPEQVWYSVKDPKAKNLAVGDRVRIRTLDVHSAEFV